MRESVLILLGFGFKKCQLIPFFLLLLFLFFWNEQPRGMGTPRFTGEPPASASRRVESGKRESAITLKETRSLLSCFAWKLFHGHTASQRDTP